MKSNKKKHHSPRTLNGSQMNLNVSYKKESLNKPVISQNWKNMFKIQPQIYDPYKGNAALSLDYYRTELRHKETGINALDNPYNKQIDI